MSGLLLPPALATDRMTSIWQRWMTHRRSIKKVKNWEILFSMQIEFLSRFSEPVAYEILHYSLRNGYQGLFEPEQPNGNSTNYPGRPPAQNPRNVGVAKGGTDYTKVFRRDEEA